MLEGEGIELDETGRVDLGLFGMEHLEDPGRNDLGWEGPRA